MDKTKFFKSATSGRRVMSVDCSKKISTQFVQLTLFNPGNRLQEHDHTHRVERRAERQHGGM